MPQIDFYVLPQAGRDARLAFACRLIEKAHARGHRIYVYTETDSDADALDELLWSYRRASFLPHARLGASDGATRPAVEIGTGNDAADHDDVLINLALSVPPFHPRFARITEIVVQDPAILEATRASWRFYSERGFAPKKHDMQK